MQRQYLAILGKSRRNVAALRSQAPKLPPLGCNMAGIPAIVGTGCNYAVCNMRSRPATNRHFAGFNCLHRRQKCPRASNYSQWLACWPPSLLVHSKKKNLSSLTRLQFRKSQSTPANTNNKNWGPALRPVPKSPRGAGLEALPC